MNMKNLLLLLLSAVLIAPSGTCFAQDDLSAHKSCKFCGMDRTMFSGSRMMVTYDDGTSVGTCSIHCTSLELGVSLDKVPQSLEVGDYNSKKLINAEKAFWVLGGSKPGVMSKRAKWAFASRADAEAFIKENGGNITSFDDAIMGSYQDMYLDTNMIREKRKMKKMQMQSTQ